VIPARLTEDRDGTQAGRMSERYHEGSRTLQDRNDTRRLADRLAERIHTDVISAHDKAFIERMSMFFLATSDAEGQPQSSYKGGDPGFLRVLDERTLCFPNYDGNGMFLSLGNVLVNPKVGLLLIDFESPNRMRIEGLASLSDELTSMYAEAQSVTVVNVTRVFPNCPRYIHRMELVERSRFVPHQGVPTPVPDWKRSELAAGVLPKGDPAAS
jgi:predicted pyridoxine 5'-phosphate oxidase superfamily flavin-nucleotide-binding protein